MLIFAFLLLFAGFIGVWLWMQKRLETTQRQLQDSFKALSFIRLIAGKKSKTLEDFEPDDFDNG